MKTSSTWVLRSIVSKIMIGVVLAAMVGSVNVMPAFGEDGGRHDNGRYEHRGRGHDRHRNVHVRRDYRPYGYSEGYYAPPPVIYVPPPQPGVGIFFSIH
jgi:hypothetical protein